MQKVQYKYGTEEQYHALPSKDPMMFIKTEKHLYLGEWQLDEAEDLSELETQNKSSLVDAINELAEAQGYINLDKEEI